MSSHEVHVKFAGKIVFVGFGSIGQGVLPLILRHIGTSADRITIVTAEDAGRAEAEQFGVKFVKIALTRDNYRQTLEPMLGAGDFLLNLSVDVSSVALDQAGARTRRAVSRHLHRAVGRRLHGLEALGRYPQQLLHAPRGAGAARGRQGRAHRRADAWRESRAGLAPREAGVAQHRRRHGRQDRGARRAASNGRSLPRPSGSRSSTSPSAIPRLAMCRRRPTSSSTPGRWTAS